ncbi:MAG: hypothetical protein HYR96_06725 [Deltaproteobacteria bacterium]|nr:hypothetical protein [Deltaproteobacteria bacterium]
MKSERVVLGLVLFCFAAVAAPGGNLSENATVLERVRAKYWTKYSGAPLANLGSPFTTGLDGSTNSKNQNGDNLVTLGYQINSTFRPGIGVPFNFLPITRDVIQVKPIYVGLTDFTILEAGNLTVHGDARVYLPIGDVAALQDVRTGFRASQLVLYRIPDSNWLVGSSSYVRTYKYGDNGNGFRPDLEVFVSPFASYRMTDRLYAVLWADVLQLTHSYGEGVGLTNALMDIQPGIRWDVTESIQVNPYVNIIPGALRWDNISWGLALNAALT